jgi:hypothetical protein
MRRLEVWAPTRISWHVKDKKAMVEILDKGELACVDLKCGPTLRLT